MCHYFLVRLHDNCGEAEVFVKLCFFDEDNLKLQHPNILRWNSDIILKKFRSLEESLKNCRIIPEREKNSKKNLEIILKSFEAGKMFRKIIERSWSLKLVSEKF